jgi:hypothetical protein
MVSMLPLLVLLASVTPDASPAPAASSEPLKEIGRVRALSPCNAIVNHANDAISRTLQNDRALTVLTGSLRYTDLDTEQNAAKRRHSIDVFYRLIGAIKANADQIKTKSKQLRDDAAASSDPDRKAELNAFADALAGALDRQQRAANETGKALLVMVERSDEAEMAVLESPEEHGTPGNWGGVMHTTGSDASSIAKKNLVRRNVWNPKLRAAADVLVERTKYITEDESHAEEHANRATAGC